MRHFTYSTRVNVTDPTCHGFRAQRATACAERARARITEAVTRVAAGLAASTGGPVTATGQRWEPRDLRLVPTHGPAITVRATYYGRRRGTFTVTLAADLDPAVQPAGRQVLAGLLASDAGTQTTLDPVTAAAIAAYATARVHNGCLPRKDRPEPCWSPEESLLFPEVTPRRRQGMTPRHVVAAATQA